LCILDLQRKQIKWSNPLSESVSICEKLLSKYLISQVKNIKCWIMVWVWSK